jgi:phosphoglycerate dehydrogenase-like enzyme
MNETLNVLVLMDFSDAIMERLKSVSPRLKFTRKAVKSIQEVPTDLIATTDILYTNSHVPDPDSAPRLRWMQSHTAGVDHLLDHPIMQTEDIIITTTSGIHAAPMAEYTLAMMFALARKIPTMLRYQQRAEWPPERFSLFMPVELRGATLGIVGYGSIGRELARLAKAFGMEVLATKRNVKVPQALNEYAEPGTGDPNGTAVDRLYPPEATRSMVAQCDFVVVALPLTEATRSIINADVLAAMKKTAFLINVARGAVVDEEALIKALETKQIAGAALDVFVQEPLPSSSPLWKAENVIISPHVSGMTTRYHETAAEVFAENLERYLAHKELLNQVNRKLGY